MQLTVIALVHFTVGALVGMGLDRLQRAIAPYPVKEEDRKGRNAEFAGSVMVIVVLQVISYIILQRMLRYMYRQAYKRMWGMIDPDKDAHAIHAGMSMGLGLAWTSTTTIAKLQYVTGTNM